MILNIDKLFDDFMRANYNKFVVYCVSKGQTAADADEIVSEALSRLYSKWIERYHENEATNKKWMNNAIGYIIMEYARMNEKHESDNIDDYTDFLPEKTEIDENLKYMELIKSVETGLSESDCKLFHLLYVVGKGYSEICDELNINNQALRTKISRLKYRIEKILKK